MIRFSSLPLSLLQLLALLPLHVRAQTSNVSCYSVPWTWNSLQQTPCVVVATLLSACQGGSSYFVQDLDSLHWGSYVGPFFADSGHFSLNQCECTVQTWNLFAACTQACQNHTMQSWDSYTSTCNSSYTGESGFPTDDFPITVPDTTEIPSWAWIPAPATSPGLWNMAAVSQNATLASASSSPGASSTGGSSGSTASAGGASSGGGSSTNVGAIVGGVVGGVAVLGLIGLGAVFLLRRQRRQGAMQTTIADAPPSSVSPSYAWMHPSLSGTPNSAQRLASSHGHSTATPPTVPEMQSATPGPQGGIYYPSAHQTSVGDLTQPDSYDPFSPRSAR